MRRPSWHNSWGRVDPFLPPRSQLRLAAIGVASFLASLSESAILVIITLTADGLIRGTAEVTVLGHDVHRVTAVYIGLGFVVARVLLSLTSIQIAATFSGEVMRRAQEALAHAYLSSSHQARVVRNLGDCSTMIVSHGRFTGDLANSFTHVATAICGLIAFGGTSLVVNPVATLALGAIGGLLLAALRPFRKRTAHAADEFTNSARVLGSDIAEIETLHREIEVFRVGDRVFDILDRRIRGAATTFTRLRFLGAATPQAFQAAMLAAAVLSLLLVADRTNGTGLAAIGAVVLLLIRSMSAAQQLVLGAQRVVEFGSYTASLNELISDLDNSAPTLGSARPSSLLPIAIEKVSFSYDGLNDVLHRIDCHITGGQLVGIVGPSGAGKSTLVELLLRLRSPTEGTITLGGTQIKEIQPDHFAARVAFVPQHPYLVRGTVADNVRFFRDIPEDEIVTALERAHLSEEINALPHGIHTRLGPDDRSLSGGQRQRLTIARALAGRPQLLILDEPTSALDAISEHAVRDTLSNTPSDLAILIVAHRYTTLNTCDRILVVNDGRIENDAAPDEVADRSDFFKAMIQETLGARVNPSEADT